MIFECKLCGKQLILPIEWTPLDWRLLDVRMGQHAWDKHQERS